MKDWKKPELIALVRNLQHERILFYCKESIQPKEGANNDNLKCDVVTPGCGSCATYGAT